MADWLESFALHHYGFTDEEIAKIDAAKEDLLHVVATIQVIWPRIERLLPVARLVAERVAQQQRESQ